MTDMQLQEITKVGPEKLSHKESNLFPLPRCRVGIEIEVENIHDYLKGDITGFWKQKPDNSLRNGGMEFVSLPLLGKDITKALLLISDWLSVRNPDFSHRTSVHIHLDCTDLSVDQLKSLLLLYVYFEIILFRFISFERMYNNYCVPIWKTTTTIASISSLFADRINRESVNRAFNNWHKYQALNLKRLNDIGTVEFRHCEGTSNHKFILKWIKVIQCLKRAAISHSFNFFATTIEKATSPLPLLHLVFGSNAKALLAKSNGILNECNRDLALDLAGSYVISNELKLDATFVDNKEKSSYSKFNPKKAKAETKKPHNIELDEYLEAINRLREEQNRPPTLEITDDPADWIL